MSEEVEYTKLSFDPYILSADVFVLYLKEEHCEHYVGLRPEVFLELITLMLSKWRTRKRLIEELEELERRGMSHREGVEAIERREAVLGPTVVQWRADPREQAPPGVD